MQSPGHLSQRERRRLEWRGLDAEGLDVYADEVREQRWESYREARRFAHLGPQALQTFDRITPRDDGERLAGMRALLLGGSAA